MSSSMNRREFLQLTASAAAMLGLSGCAGVKITPWPTARRPRPIAPGAKIRIAQIGFAGKGSGDVKEFKNEDIVALCDVDWSNRNVQSIFKMFPNAKKYRDFRKMLLEMDDQIDAVVVSTPDHMHFLPAYMAMSLGKHVYVQKPLTQTIGEARELMRMARKHGVCTQMGNQGHANDDIRQLKEWIQADLIGNVREVHVWTNRPIWPQGMMTPAAAETASPEMDWDLWIGRAASRPFNPAYHPFKWRGWLEFGTGALGDMGCHSINGPYFALDLGAPTSVKAETSGLTPQSFPDWSIISYEFPANGPRPALTLTWYDGGKKPERPRDLEPGRKMNNSGQFIIGDKGTILSQAETTSSIRLVPEARMRDMRDKLPPATLPRVPDRDHYQDWARAVRAGAVHATGTNFDYAVPLVEMVLLGNIALRVPGEKILWDGKRMQVTSHPELNKYVNPDYRQGWKPEALA